MKLNRLWLGVSMFLAALAWAPQARAQGEELSDLADFVISSVILGVDSFGDRIDIQHATARTDAGIEFTLTAGERAPEPDVPRMAADFFGGLREARISYIRIKNEIRLLVRMKGWTGVRIKDPAQAKKRELVALGIPAQVRYTIKFEGGRYKVLCDTPRKRNALRLRPHDSIGNLWLREVHLDPTNWEGRVKLGIKGNMLGLEAGFTVRQDARPGEPPLIIKPDVRGTIRENGLLSLLLPFFSLFL